MFKRISFGDGNMIAPGDNSFSFRIDDFPAQIPKDVHFTFGYNKETGDINLHVTRNVQDQNDKPNVRVAIFHKDDLNRALPALAAKLIKVHLIPLSFYNRGKKTKYREYQQRKFIDLSEVAQSSGYEGGEFLPEAKKHFKKKGGKGKYEMQPTFEDGLQRWSRSKFRMKTMRAAIKPLREMDLMNTMWGFLFATEYSGPALISNGGVYVLRTGLEPADLALALFGKEKSKQLGKKIDDAIRRVRNAKTSTDTKDAGAPIRLFERPNKGN
ncbi:MAG: hypothetical protein JSU01_02625 [Bacteroidetes bacterium]|nr:hypothetical protein [Bacteroidota bacterium]